MRHFSFKILALCILLPPVLYIFSVQSLEGYLKERYAVEIENIYLGDTALLLNGSKRLKESINDNIKHYLQRKILNHHGLKIDVTISTRRGKLLYPGIFEEDRNTYMPGDANRVASENYALMNEGLKIRLDAKIEQNKLLSNSILAGLVFLSLMTLYLHYRTVTRRIEQDEIAKSREINRLVDLEAKSSRKLTALDHEHDRLASELSRLKATLDDEKDKASRNEDELFDEIAALEDKLNENLELQELQQEEINGLKEQLQQHESDKQKSGKKKIKASQAVGKRFSTLYKNVQVNNRALEGYIELNDDLKIKAEETIHQLNHDPGQVVIKRKVFIGKRDKKNIKEVIFGYKGRLYFRNLKDSGIEILAIGTKNTQAREMEFLNKL